MKPPPYVGVSGITTPEQVSTFLDAWPADAPAQSLMIGVLASQKTMSGGECSARSPRPEDIAKIWPSDPRALNLVHYFTKDASDIAEQLLRAVGSPCDLCDGVQINVPWPPADQLAMFRLWAPKLIRIVLQVGPRVLEGPYSIEVIAELIDRGYRGLITDVLIDVSGGRGVSLDPTQVRHAVECMRSWNEDLGIGIAGGLCAETLPVIADLVREYDLSIDAEGRLRNEEDQLDVGAARAYLLDAARIQGWR